MNDLPFSQDQQEYLKGFMVGVEARRGALGLPLGPVGEAAAPVDPTDLQRAAQDRTIAAGGRLVAEEEAKRKRHPLDRFDAISELAAQGRFPRGTDVFLTKFHGLFYVAPTQDSFMCRLRIPGGILSAHQLRGVAAISDDLAAGHADITSRANLQIREIPAGNAPEMLIRLAELGLTSRGAGADNVRNVTGSPTAGIDPQELIDTRPYSRAIHHFILNRRELYGLPRKFNIAFDGGGRVAVLEDTNDIAFSAAQATDGKIWFRLGLGGITGHGDLARGTGVAVVPDETTQLCNAILRVFIREGDRTNRTRARLKYVLDGKGMAWFLEQIEAELGHPLTRMDDAAFLPRPAQDRLGHLGRHAQRQPGLNYLGVLCPMARLSAPQLRGLADIAERFGSGTIRLTVWQNLLISDIANGSGANDRVAEAEAAIAALGLATQAGPLRAGLVACTGAAGCKFAASHTKQHGEALVAWLESRITLDQPINIHLTGCPHSCAQHLIADIGLLGAKVERGEDMVEGYDLHVGGGAGAQAGIGRLVRAKIAADALFPVVLTLLRAWQNGKSTPDESFQSWSARHDTAGLAELCDHVTEAA